MYLHILRRCRDGANVQVVCASKLSKLLALGSGATIADMLLARMLMFKNDWNVYG